MENKNLLIARVRETLASALAKNADLWGYSPLDLIADNVDGTPIELRAAIVSAGPFPQASERVQSRIEFYSLLCARNSKSTQRYQIQKALQNRGLKVIVVEIDDSTLAIQRTKED